MCKCLRWICGTFPMQNFDHPYATACNIRLVDRCVTCNMKMFVIVVGYFTIQIWHHFYAIAGHGRLVDRFVTCNAKMCGVSGSLFPYKFGITPTLQPVMFDWYVAQYCLFIALRAKNWESSKDIDSPGH